MKASRIRNLHISRKSVEKDNEGVPIITWGDPVEVQGEVWPAGGDLQAQTYGERINRIMNIKVRGSYTVIIEDDHEAYQFKNFTFCEGDGVCLLRQDKPDYRILSIKPYHPLRMEVERI